MLKNWFLCDVDLAMINLVVETMSYLLDCLTEMWLLGNRLEFVMTGEGSLEKKGDMIQFAVLICNSFICRFIYARK